MVYGERERESRGFGGAIAHWASNRTVVWCLPTCGSGRHGCAALRERRAEASEAVHFATCAMPRALHARGGASRAEDGRASAREASAGETCDRARSMRERAGRGFHSSRLGLEKTLLGGNFSTMKASRRKTLSPGQVRARALARCPRRALTTARADEELPLEHGRERRTGGAADDVADRLFRARKLRRGVRCDGARARTVRAPTRHDALVG